ncbi:MAG: HNH endonuclease family protein [Dehalococcoidia bacterium]
MHRLGNLVLLPPGLNSKLGAKRPREKAEDYYKTGLLIAQDVAGHLSDWELGAIQDRERKLIQWVAHEWSD